LKQMNMCLEVNCCSQKGVQFVGNIIDVAFCRSPHKGTSSQNLQPIVKMRGP
jgi:hypothetical protein